MKKALNFQVPQRTVKSSEYVAETMSNAFAKLFDGQQVSCEMQTTDTGVYLTFWSQHVVARVEMGELPAMRCELLSKV